MMAQKKKPVNPYNYDPMSPGSGAFKALTREHFKDIEVVRGGITFAVCGSFEHLTVASMLSHSGHCSTVKDAFNYARSSYQHYRSHLKPQVFYPTQEAAVIANITPAVGVGAKTHEAGHKVCDKAGTDPNWNAAEKLYGHLIQKCMDLGIWNAVANLLPKWSNVTADCRLERMMGHMYPNTITRFHAVQSWVHGLEKETRLKGSFGDHLMCAIRDYGKGWGNPVFNEYSQEAQDEVMRLSPIIKQLWTEGQSIDDTVHLPVQVALELLIELNEQSLLPPTDDEDGQGGDGDGDGQDGDDDGQGGDGTISEPCDDGDDGDGDGQGDGDGDGQGKGKGKGKGDGDDDGQGDGQGDEDGDGQGDEDGQGGDGKDGDEDGDGKDGDGKDGDGKDGDGEDGKDGDDGKGGKGGKATGKQGKEGDGDVERMRDSGDCSSSLPSKEKVARIMRGEGQALDPSSAMERAFKDGLANGNIGHTVYVGNGSKNRVVSDREMKRIIGC